MIKYIGGALLITAGWLLGGSLCKIYSDRVKLLERFEKFIIYCESEITFYRSEMINIIEKFIEENNRFDKLIFYNDKDVIINNEIRFFIKNFLSGINELDSESLKYYFDETKNKLKILSEKSKKDLEIKGKLLKKVIPLLSAGLFILTI